MDRDHQTPAPNGASVLLWHHQFDLSQIEIPLLTEAAGQYKVVDVSGLSLQEKIERGKDAYAIIFMYDAIPVKMLDAAPNLRVITRYGVGSETIPLSDMTPRGILGQIVPGYCPIAVADHAMTIWKSACRQIPWVFNSVVVGRSWPQEFDDVPIIETLPEDGIKKTFGIIGCGKIGEQTAILANAHQQRVIGYDRYRPDHELRQYGIEPVSLEQLLEESDTVCLHTPLTDETSHMIYSGSIEKMKEGVVIINTSRGGVMREHDVVEGITSGRIARVAVDVLENETDPDKSDLRSFAALSAINRRKVLITSHVAPRNPLGVSKLRESVCRATISALEGKLWDGILNHQVVADHRDHQNWLDQLHWSMRWPLIKNGELPPLK